MMRLSLKTNNLCIYEEIPMGFCSNIFLLKSDSESILIDVGFQYNAEKPLDILEEIFSKPEEYGSISKIILTHEHIDHIGSLFSYQNFFEKIDIPIIASESTANTINTFSELMDNARIIDPITNSLRGKNALPFKIEKIHNEITIGTVKLEVIKTPGHSKGSICLFEKSNKILFSGDTVFPQGSFGRADLPTGNMNTLAKSLELLTNLNCEHLYPGHMTSIIQNAKNEIQESYANIKFYVR